MFNVVSHSRLFLPEMQYRHCSVRGVWYLFVCVHALRLNLKRGNKFYLDLHLHVKPGNENMIVYLRMYVSPNLKLVKSPSSLSKARHVAWLVGR